MRLEERLTTSFVGQDASRLREVLRRVAAVQLDARTPTALQESTGFLVTRAHLRTHREFLAALQPLGIEPRHYGSLRVLRVVGPVTQGQLAALLDVSPATVVSMVDHLEQRGLLTRQRDSADRRVYRLHLTEQGEAVLEQAITTAAGVQESWLGGPRSRDRRDIVRLLTLLLTDAAQA